MQNKQTENTNIEERFEQPKKSYPNKQKQGLQKKIKIVLPQHSKKQEKITTKSKFFYKYSEISLIQMSRLK